jgi:hypothetical protein
VAKYPVHCRDVVKTGESCRLVIRENRVMEVAAGERGERWWLGRGGGEASGVYVGKIGRFEPRWWEEVFQSVTVRAGSRE